MFVSTFDVFGHGVHGVPVRIDGDQDGSQVGKRLDFICGKQNQSVRSLAPPSPSTVWWFYRSPPPPPPFSPAPRGRCPDSG